MRQSTQPKVVRILRSVPKLIKMVINNIAVSIESIQMLIMGMARKPGFTQADKTTT